ncbi:hypothetical protein EJF18_11094 [Clavispora lusitaniae]|uniref:GPI-anchored protein n=3 Tax=Clavispora lusitaniae TaxID=36911 RepID=C4XYP3_CLAL4|nr:uncharacterized protein CLUG_01066 [Clavispora lusitaniae ATCC 42720]KAF5212625.1 hypothetical protein E0198_000121 [Clavispora lusitaniae]EEQ36943.1 predicted protein [Clavispora lusitaniae ATCC 42720]KAF7584931.1 hypothetical protein FOB63_001003 [Clavispora lusitaniae]OVF08187.1 hypothetical protein A9F13_09g01166 [Clavispora lusitaniae]QFZ25970.1 hypothetical protein EJF14_11094 [Clavispora lusitaniae]
MRITSIALLSLPLVLAADGGISAALADYSNLPKNSAAQNSWLMSFLGQYSKTLHAEAGSKTEDSPGSYSFPTSVDSSVAAIIASITAKASKHNVSGTESGSASETGSESESGSGSSAGSEAITASSADSSQTEQSESSGESSGSSETSSTSSGSSSSSSSAEAGRPGPIYAIGAFAAGISMLLL